MDSQQFKQRLLAQERELSARVARAAAGSREPDGFPRDISEESSSHEQKEGQFAAVEADRMVLNYLPEHVAAAVYRMSSKDVLGIYSFNYKLGVAMLLIVQMFRMAWTPFSLQHARHPGAPQLYSRVLTGLMLICAAAFLGIAELLERGHRALEAVARHRHFARDSVQEDVGQYAFVAGNPF